MYDIMLWSMISFFNFLWVGTILYLGCFIVGSIFVRNTQSLYRLYLVCFFLVIVAVPFCFRFTDTQDLNIQQVGLTVHPKSTVSNFLDQATVMETPKMPRSSSRVLTGILDASKVENDQIVASLHGGTPVINTSTASGENKNPLKNGDSIESFEKFGNLSTHWTMSRIVFMFALFYCGGLLLMNIRLLRMITGLRMLAKQVGSPPSKEMKDRLAGLCLRLGLARTPKMMLVRCVSSPVVYGSFRPIILFPASLLTGLSGSELDSILLHELAHIRRLDPLVVWCQRIAETFLFFHPVIWLISRRLDILREQCCDEVVVSQGVPDIDYVSGLCKVAENFSHNYSSNLLNAAAGVSEGELLFRVRKILDQSNSTDRKISFGAFSMMLILFVFCFGLLSVLANDSTSVVADSDGREDLVKVENVGLQDTIRLKIVDPKGRFLSGATVFYTLGFGTPRRKAVSNKEGVVKLKKKGTWTSSVYLMIQVLSADHRHIANQNITPNENVTKVQLEKAIKSTVQVFSGGKPAPNTEVRFYIGRGIILEKTNTKGEVSAYISADQELSNVHCVALHPLLGVGANSFQKSRITIDLLEPKPFTLVAKDQHGEPAENAPINISYRTDEQLDVSTHVFQGGQILTDENGEAEVTFLPKRYQMELSIGIYGNKYRYNFRKGIKQSLLKNTKTIHVIRFPKKYLVKGKVLRNGKPIIKSAKVKYFERLNDQPISTGEVTTKQDGTFEVRVGAMSEASFIVSTEKWYSSVVTRNFGPRPDQESQIQLKAKTAGRVKVFVTIGKDRKPASGVHVSTDSSMNVGKLLFGSDGNDLNAMILKSGHASTDENGVAVIGVPPGGVKVRVDFGKQGKVETANCKPGNVEEITFHFPSDGSRTIIGKVTGKGDLALDEVTVLIQENHSYLNKMQFRSDKNGNWVGNGIHYKQPVIYALTKDKAYSSLYFTGGIRKKVPKMTLKKSATVHGRLVDQNGEPWEDVAVIVKVETSTLFGMGPKVFYYPIVRTDSDGRFQIQGLAPGFSHQLVVKSGIGRVTYLHKELSLKEGKTSSLGDVLYRQY